MTQLGYLHDHQQIASLMWFTEVVVAVIIVTIESSPQLGNQNGAPVTGSRYNIIDGLQKPAVVQRAKR